MTQGIVAIILAGGQGKRMRSSDVHKVCFPVAGEPAIVRTVRQLKQVGLRRFFVVVGQKPGRAATYKGDGQKKECESSSAV